MDHGLAEPTFYRRAGVGTDAIDLAQADGGMIRSYGRVLMPVARLLALVMLFALSAGLASAQSQNKDASNLVVFQGRASMKVAENSAFDALQAGPSSAASAQQAAGDGTLLASAADEYRHFRNDPGASLGPDADRTCYYIRDYVVLRDSPHSDSVHRDGSSICVPGSRFRVYRTVHQGH
jgi:hypothetical protein